MGGGGKGASTSYSERPLTDNELRLLDAQTASLGKAADVADRQQTLSEQNQRDWESAYRSLETGGISDTATRANGYNNSKYILTKSDYDARQAEYQTGLAQRNGQLSSYQSAMNLAKAKLDKTPQYREVQVGKGAPTKEETEEYASAKSNYENALSKYNSYNNSLSNFKKDQSKYQIYNDDPNSNLREAILKANEDFGKVDEGTYTRQKANLFNGLDSSYTQAENDLSASLARRGISNSGIGATAYKDLYSNKANAMSQANNQAYNTGVQAGDTYRQQKVANLSGYSQLGRGMAGTAQNYLAQAGGMYGQNAQIQGNTASGLGSLDNSYNAAQWNAKAQASAGKGAMTGSLVGAGATLGGAGIIASDKRLKENIQKVGSYNGINIYVWDWNEKGMEITKGEVASMGVIAQEVQEVRPDCVIEAEDGYLRVLYNKLFNGVSNG